MNCTLGSDAAIIATILANVADDVSWEFKEPAELSRSGIRHSRHEVAGFLAGIAAEHADPNLEMTEFLSSGDAPGRTIEKNLAGPWNSGTD